MGKDTESTPWVPELSAFTREVIANEKARLAEATVEHGVVLLINADGHVTKRLHFCSDHPSRVEVPITKIIEAVEQETDCWLVWTAHNHPGGPATPSADDRIKRFALQKGLGRMNVALEDEVIASRAAPTPTRESSLGPTDWERRCAESADLWSAYGGVPPWTTRGR